MLNVNYKYIQMGKINKCGNKLPDKIIRGSEHKW